MTHPLVTDEIAIVALEAYWDLPGTKFEAGNIRSMKAALTAALECRGLGEVAYRAQQSITVLCECGWRGEQSELLGRIQSSIVLCPQCKADLTKYPGSSTHPNTIKE